MLENQAFSKEISGQRPRLLSIVVPVFNECQSVGPFLSAIDELLLNDELVRSTGLNYEVIFVDDGSQDGTAAALHELCRLNAHVKVLKLSRNFGKEAALSAGLDASSGDAVIPMDVDLQDPPELVVPMIAKWLGGAKIVNAKRIDRRSDTFFKRTSASAFYRIVNKIADHPIDDNVGDFRLLDRDAVNILNRMTEHSRFNKGLFSWIGFATETVEYSRPQRDRGDSKWRPAALFNLALDGITSTTTLPLRIWSLVGAAIAILAFSYAAGLVAYTLFTGGDAPGYASIMVAVLFLGGLNLLSLGMMGEYLGRIAIQVRNRPLYVIDSKEGF